MVSLKDCGITRGWDYQKRSDGTQTRMSEFADSFFSMLLDIHQYRPELIAPGINVTNDYRLSRSERQGDTTRSQASKVPEDIINVMNRWEIG